MYQRTNNNCRQSGQTLPQSAHWTPYKTWLTSLQYLVSVTFCCLYMYASATIFIVNEAPQSCPCRHSARTIQVAIPSQSDMHVWSSCRSSRHVASTCCWNNELN